MDRAHDPLGPLASDLLDIDAALGAQLAHDRQAGRVGKGMEERDVRAMLVRAGFEPF